MRHLLITLLMVALFVVSGCRAGTPQPRPAPQSPAAPQAPAGEQMMPPPGPPGAAGLPGAATPSAPGVATPSDVPDLAHGPEHATRPHEDPPHPQPTAYMRGDPAMRLVALTFDDGPDGVFTPQILDVLRQNHVPATFFVVGNRVTAHPGVVKRMVAEGHEVGNHSFHHPMLSKLTAQQITNELNTTNDAVRGITGRPMTILRPPYGDVNPLVSGTATGLGYRLVLWDIDSLDWKPHQTALGVVHNVVPNIRNGAIILHHSAGGRGEDLTSTIQALPTEIRTLRNQGYRIVTVSELLRTGNVRPGVW
ncbi:MAG: chitooligosaccharide deacetylase [Firmicutes bacterium]|nr:chitooligosaccharide deacetylase [Bacillota bacterium]